MAEYIPDPFKNYTLKNAPKPAVIGAIETKKEISSDDLLNLDSMDIDQLKSLIRRFTCQCGLAATMSKDETAQAMRDVLAETALRPIAPGINMKADIRSRLDAIDKWLDREEGKPTQAINTTVVVGVVEIVQEIARRKKEKLVDVTPLNQ